MQYANHAMSMPMPPSSSVFPVLSAKVFKEALAVIGLMLLVAATSLLGAVLVQALFGEADANAACTILDPRSLLAPWCSALI